MEKNKKNLYLAIISILLLVIIVTFYLLSKKQETFIGTLIPETPYNLDEVFPEQPDSTPIEPSAKELIFGKVKSLCDLGSPENIKGSRVGPILKKDIIKEIDQRFILLELPNLVVEACAGYDDFYLQQIIQYLRSDDEVMVIYDPENVRKLGELIQNIKFDSSGIDKKRLREDSEHFKEIFFDKNLINIMSVFFSDYMINKDEPKKFFKSYSFQGFEVTNANFDRLLQKFNTFLLGSNFSGIQDFREHVMKNYNITDKKILIEELNNEYLAFEKKLLDDMQIDLTISMKHMQALEDFYLGDEFKKIKENQEMYDLFLNVGFKHFLFSVLSDDYADGLDEPWSGKEFFGDYHVGKFLPRLGYLYMLDQSNK